MVVEGEEAIADVRVVVRSLIGKMNDILFNAADLVDRHCIP